MKTATANGTDNSIELNNIALSFDGDDTSTPNRIFDGLNLTLPQGEFISILGPSGCGKSTLLRLIAGLCQPQRGGITINSQPVTDAGQPVGFVFQKPTLLPWLSTRDNILFPIKHQGGRVTAADQQRANALITLIGLEQYADSLPAKLSGGMQQRVGIARALIQDQDILLMDEPFSALDAMNREKLGFELLSILSKTQKTVIFITHSIPEAVLLSDRVIVLSSGPAQVIDNITIDFEPPRSIATMKDPAFSAICDNIRRHFY